MEMLEQASLTKVRSPDRQIQQDFLHLLSENLDGEPHTFVKLDTPARVVLQLLVTDMDEANFAHDLWFVGDGMGGIESLDVEAHPSAFRGRNDYRISAVLTQQNREENRMRLVTQSTHRCSCRLTFGVYVYKSERDLGELERAMEGKKECCDRRASQTVCSRNRAGSPQQGFFLKMSTLRLQSGNKGLR